MLAGCALDSNKAECQPVFLRFGGFHAMFFQILFHITVSRLLRKCANGSGAKNMIRPEKYFGIFMGLCLIFSGEVQIDIGRFFVSREAKKGFKRNIKTVAVHRGAAMRAGFFRHVCSATIGPIRHKLAVPTLRAHIVRRERVDLCNTGHKSNDRRTHTAPAANQITVFQ